MDRDRRNTQNFGRLFYREPAKEAELHDTAFLWIHGRQADQRIIEG